MRQYVQLAAVGRGERLPLPALTIGSGPAGDWDTWGARRELRALFEDGYFTAPKRETPNIGLRVSNLELDQQSLSNASHPMHDLLSLEDVSDHEVLAVHVELVGQYRIASRHQSAVALNAA